MMLSSRELAAKLGMHIESVRRLARAKSIPVKIGGNGREYKFDFNEVLKALNTPLEK